MRLHVLMVEDNLLNGELARDLLELDGHMVDLAATAEATRRRIAIGPVPDLVLMDIQLPDGDGVSLLAELREVPRLAETTMVALTAHALQGDQARLLDAGFDAVITKPIDTRTFVPSIVALTTARRGL
jgi:CheY-like chemotaxis protein